MPRKRSFVVGAKVARVLEAILPGEIPGTFEDVDDPAGALDVLVRIGIEGVAGVVRAKNAKLIDETRALRGLYEHATANPSLTHVAPTEFIVGSVERDWLDCNYSKIGILPTVDEITKHYGHALYDLEKSNNLLSAIEDCKPVDWIPADEDDTAAATVPTTTTFVVEDPW